jgi:hypothetical protein
MIHDAILQRLQDELEAALITNILPDDAALATIVKLGPLQGDPAPDDARIAITLHENDPDVIYEPGTTGMTDKWNDEPSLIECGGSITWYRRFSVKARCLFIDTGEDLDAARKIASTIRDRIEATLLNASFAGVVDATSGEFVSKSVFSHSLKGETIQAGGPPDAYDYHIKVRFQVETTRGVQP